MLSLTWEKIVTLDALANAYTYISEVWRRSPIQSSPLVLAISEHLRCHDHRHFTRKEALRIAGDDKVALTDIFSLVLYLL